MNTCPECGSCLNATVTITLYDVQLKQGEIVSNDGGPTAEADLIEAANQAGPSIICAQGHIVKATE